VSCTLINERGPLGGDRGTLTYLIEGHETEQGALTELLATAPTLYNYLQRDTAACRVEWHAIGTGGDVQVFLGYAEYRRKARKETGDTTTQFEVGGATEHITQSISTISKTPVSGTAPDHKGAIGVDEKGNIAGVDIVAPQLRFSKTYYIAAAAVTDAYIRTLAGLAAHVNDATFMGFAAGEVLFIGARGSQRGEEDWEITFDFAASPNKTNISIGGVITVPAKKGWEYLWVQYETIEDPTAKKLTRRPIAAYVEKVYDTGDFGALVP